MARYVFGRTVAMDYAAAIDKVTQELAKEGFGVLTEIDVAATMKKKLDLDMAPYKILGACNPQFAAKVIAAEPSIGALLPCNVVVRVTPEGGTLVEFMDPNAVLEMVNRPEVNAVAAEVRTRLERVMNSL